VSAAAERVDRSQPRGAQRMARTFASLLSAEVLTRAFAFVAALIVVRALAPGAFGAFAYALALASVLGLLVDLGLPTMLIRDVSARPGEAPALLGRALRLELSLGGIVVGGAMLLAAAGVVPGPAGPVALMLAFGGIVVTTLGSAFEAGLTGAGKAHLVTVSRTGRSVALVAASGLVAATEPDIEAFLAAWIAGELSGAITAGALCSARAVRPVLAVTRGELRGLLVRTVPFALLAGFIVLYLRIDILMLGLLGSDVEVGNYGVAARIMEAALIVPVYFGSAFLATISHGERAAEVVASRTARAMRYLLVVCVPLAFALAIAGHPLVHLLAGGDYGLAESLFVQLTPIVALMASYVVLASLQIALDRTTTLVRITVAGVVLKLALNAYAIPAHGARGAAASAVIGEALVVVAQWRNARGQLDLGALLRWAGRLAACAAVMVAAGLAVLAATSWPFALTAAMAAFYACALASGCLPPAELRAAWASLSSTRAPVRAEP
jgi:O-antigen/teichoic acid export membrane protein